MDDEKKSKMRKIVGAGIGWVVAGPVGAALGLLVGHTMDNDNNIIGATLKSNSLKQYYDVLEVPYSADREEVKAAYKKLAQKYHPDRFGDSTDPVIEELAREKMCRINEAYAAIKGAMKKTTKPEN